MKMLKSMGLPIVLIVTIALALACGGSGGGGSSASDEKNVTVRLAGKSDYTVRAYDLIGSITDPGPVVATATYDSVSDSFNFDLDPSKSYRIRIGINGIEMLETIVLASQLEAAKDTGVLDVGAVNGATTFLTYYAIESAEGGSIEDSWKTTLNNKGISSFEDMRLSNVSSKLNAEDLQYVKLSVLLIGMMTRASEEGERSQDQWNNVATSISKYVQSDSSTEGGLSDLMSAIQDQIDLSTPLEVADFGSAMASLLGSSEDPTSILRSLLVSKNTNLTKYLNEGFSALEGNGNSEQQDLVTAFEKFHAAKTAEPSSSQALFFTAITRMASMPFRESNASADEITYTANDLEDAVHIPVTYTNNDEIQVTSSTFINPNRYDELPTFAKLAEGVQKGLIPNLNASIGDLNAITYLDQEEFTLDADQQGDSSATSSVVFDKIDISAILAFHYWWKAFAYYCTSLDMSVADKTDTAGNMKDFVLELMDDPMLSGNATFSLSLGSSSIDSGNTTDTGAVTSFPVSTLNYIGSYPGILEGVDLSQLDIWTYSGNYYVDGDIDHLFSSSTYQYKGNMHGFATVSSNTLQGFSANVYLEAYLRSTGNLVARWSVPLSASLSTGSLTVVSEESSIDETDVDDFVNNNSNFLRMSETELRASREALQESIALFNEVVDALQASGANRENNLIDSISELKRPNDDHTFSTAEIDAFQTFISDVSLSLNGPKSIDPTPFSTTLAAKSFDSSVVFNDGKPLRHYLTNSSDQAFVNSGGNIEFNDTRVQDDLRQGEAEESFETLGEGLEVFLSGLETPENVGVETTFHILQWWDSFKADGYNVYWAQSSSVTPSNFSSLSGGGNYTISGGNVTFLSLSSMGFSSGNVGDFYFVVTAYNNTLKPGLLNGGNYESGPTTAVSGGNVFVGSSSSSSSSGLVKASTSTD